MKFGIVVCILGLLAIHEASCTSYAHFPALLSGNCLPEEVPSRDLESCAKIECTKTEQGEIRLSGVPCSLSRCQNGKELGSGPPDLKKKYPACCTPSTCD